MKSSFLLIYFILNISLGFPHPTGDMVFTNNTLLWSYVCPVGNIQHKACVMLWDEENGVRPWLTSDYSASDWMISVADSKSVYLIERYYDHNEESHYSRLLYGEVEQDPIVTMEWFRDDHRFGEHGFVVLEDNTIIFARYPSLYKLNEDFTIEKIVKWELPVNSIRNTDEGDLLVISDSAIWLADDKFNILQKWNNLLEPIGSDSPFGGNRISDMDFSNSRLYISYWGKRRFEVLENENRKTLMSFSSPWVPHHIAIDGSKIFMLSSTIAPDITNKIEPSLWMMENGNFELIWGDTGAVTNVQINFGSNDYRLFQNYANPFNPSTLIRYSIAKKSQVELEVFNINGEKTRSLVSSIQERGDYFVEFDRSDLSSGIYIYRIQIGNFVEARKMVLLK
jgi:hypothetical protein